MLRVRNLKQPFDLHIRPWEHAALIRLVDDLMDESRKIDMRATGLCLGSRVAIIGDRSPFKYMGMVFSHALSGLYFPGIRATGEIDYENPGWSPDNRRAALAITSYLECGDPRWSDNG